MTTRTNNRFRTASVAIACLLVVTACAGSDEEAEPTGTNGATATTEDDPDAETSTTATDTTTASTTTTTSSTTQPPPETTEAPAATTVPSSPDVDPRTAELRQALQGFNDTWATCASQLPNCDLQALAEYVDGAQLETGVGIMSGANTNGWSASNTESYRTQFEAVEFVSADTAIVTACNEDGIVISDGQTIISDRFSSRRTEWTFERSDGIWKMTTGIELESAVGVDNSLCSF